MSLVTSHWNETSDFESELRGRVRDYLETRPEGPHAPVATRLKCLLIFALALLTYMAILFECAGHGVTLVLVACFGLLQLALAFNVGHDAAHGSFSRSSRVNRLLAYTWDAIGISNHFWRLRHNVAHHGHTNVVGLDLDIEQGYLLRLNPDEEWRSFHRYQHIYAPIVYSMFSLYLVTLRDFQLYRRLEYGNLRLRGHRRRVALELAGGKLFYFGYSLFLPLCLTSFTLGQVLSAFVGMHALVGLATVAILAPAHLTEDSILTPTYQQPDVSFVEYQLATTSDIRSDSRLVTALCGGLNAQVIHHLFPRISHGHHHTLSKIVERVAASCGLNYRRRTMLGALRSHARYLRRLGQHPRPADAWRATPTRPPHPMAS